MNNDKTKDNKVIQMLDLKKSTDVPFVFKDLGEEEALEILYFEESNIHSGGIIVNSFYRCFCLND